VLARGVVADIGAFGENQPNSTLGPPPVVAGDIGARDPAWRMPPRHRRHHDPIGQIERAETERFEQQVDRRRRIGESFV
jgi:hypothetical protein